MQSQTFGEKLKEHRTNLNYSLKLVGEKIGYNPRLLSKIEKGNKTAPESMLKGLSDIYDIPYKELIIKYLSEKVYYQIQHYDCASEVLEVVQKRVKKEGKGTQVIKSKANILASIKAYFSDKPIERAYVFGSFARNNLISRDSDIDILVVFKKPNKITLFDLIEMKKELSDRTGRAIDLVEEGQELPTIKNRIQQEKVLVYAS